MDGPPRKEYNPVFVRARRAPFERRGHPL